MRITPAITREPRRARALRAAVRVPDGQGASKARDRPDRQVDALVMRAVINGTLRRVIRRRSWHISGICGWSDRVLPADEHRVVRADWKEHAHPQATDGM